MSLINLEVRHVRNLKDASLEPSPVCNVVFGANASGKTSLLEALYLLGLARSFRTTHIREVVQHGQGWLRVVGRLEQETGQPIVVGVERSSTECRVRVAGEEVRRLGVLASWLPVQVLNPEAHEVLEQGPRLRRQFLDWGVFHVEHQFLEDWHAYQRALRQRNAALRLGATERTIRLWDAPLVAYGERIAKARRTYLAQLLPILSDHVLRLLDTSVEFSVQAGWTGEDGMAAALERSWPHDQKVGYTRQGPHRGELSIRVAGRPAEEVLSRGQQKLLVSAMRLAQVALLAAERGRQCVVLVDDLAAELDRERRGRLLELLIGSGAQVFVTTTERELLETAWPALKVFHVEHGNVREMV